MYGVCPFLILGGGISPSVTDKPCHLPRQREAEYKVYTKVSWYYIYHSTPLAESYHLRSARFCARIQEPMAIGEYEPCDSVPRIEPVRAKMIGKTRTTKRCRTYSVGYRPLQLCVPFLLLFGDVSKSRWRLANTSHAIATQEVSDSVTDWLVANRWGKPKSKREGRRNEL